MKVQWDEKIYALYKGEEFISVGTIPEISADTGKSINFLKYMTFPVYERKVGNSINSLQIFLLDLDEQD